MDSLYDKDEDGFDACSDCDDPEPDTKPGMDEVCDAGIDNDCNGEQDESCNVDWSGAWVLEGPVSYSCAYGLNVAFTSMQLVQFDPSITVTAVGGAQPGTMAGTASGGTFSVSNVLPRACAETYVMTNEFTGPDTFDADFQASFSGDYCYDCALQSWSVTGHRSSR